MTCEQAINYLYSRLKFGSVPGLERIAALCELLGNPQDKLRYIHVAGTNGKGSVCSMISNMLILHKDSQNVFGKRLGDDIILLCQIAYINCTVW